MNARELITRALNFSDIVSANLQTPTGSEIAIGLDLLNDILGEKSSAEQQIPYFDQVTFPGVVGQEEYFVQSMVELSTFTVNLGDVRYEMTQKNRREYWGEGRVNNISSLPSSYYSERGFNDDNVSGMKIWTYFDPSQTSYIFEAVGRFSLNEVGLDTVMSDSLERFYTSYLKYALAERLCQYFNQPFGNDKISTLQTLERRLTQINGVDPNLKLVNSFPGESSLNYADVNIGRGWRP